MKSSFFHKTRIITLVTTVLIILLYFQFSSNSLSYQTPNEASNYSSGSKSTITGSTDTNTLTSSAVGKSEQPKSELDTDDDIYSSVIMPKMPDLEAKQELGRNSWKYFHTLLARFPEHPTELQREKLNTFLHLFAELYPCGECSYHFVKLLEKYPPQTSTRITAAIWGCHIHNIVNEFLEKPEYDCSKILEDYDCGCGEEETAQAAAAVLELEDTKPTLNKPVKGKTNKEGSSVTLEKEAKQHG